MNILTNHRLSWNSTIESFQMLLREDLGVTYPLKTIENVLEDIYYEELYEQQQKQISHDRIYPGLCGFFD